MDDGADVVGVIHGERPRLSSIIGGTEETTTGVIRLKALGAEGTLGYPIVAVNDAEHQAPLRQPLRHRAVDARRHHPRDERPARRPQVVVIGYGWCGRGVAMRAKGMGANVIVCEVDPLKALEAVMDGYGVMPAVEAAKVGDIWVTVTGDLDAIAGEQFDVMKDGAIICNSGHFNVEINMAELDAITEATSRLARSSRGTASRTGGRSTCSPRAGS